MWEDAQSISRISFSSHLHFPAHCCRGHWLKPWNRVSEVVKFSLVNGYLMILISWCQGHLCLSVIIVSSSQRDQIDPSNTTFPGAMVTCPGAVTLHRQIPAPQGSQMLDQADNNEGETPQNQGQLHFILQPLKMGSIKTVSQVFDV